ncbi:MAG: outer membrane protein assembly factor BamA [Deltaproteobacteria bacterium]|nr:outer membrane protein assembly factor BamA [Deltaproteobacteria bacterium]
MSAIDIEGNRRVEPDAIRNALASKVGSTMERSKITADVHALFALGYFEDISVDAQPAGPNQIKLVVKVAEKPAIRDVRITGNDELSTDDIRDLVDIRTAQILDLDAVHRNAKKIQDKYVEKGFYLAEITPKVVPQPDNTVSVVFAINEHAKVQVKSITFVGNEKVPSADLRSVMETQEGNILSFLTSAGTYREEVFQRDLSLIQFAYYDRGFINVRVGKPQVEITPDKKYLFLTVPITEGEQFNVGKIDYSGDILGTKETLGTRVHTESGALFNRSQLQADISGLNDLYLDQGYCYVNISPLTNVNNDTRIVDLTFDVQKGPKCYVERIDIVGNHKTRDRVIRRELRIYEGELFTGTGMKQSKGRVNALGFFETVEVTQKKGSRDDSVIVEVSVKEKPTGTFQVGFGFSSVESFIFTATLQQNNLLGWGQTASLSAQISSLRSLVQLSYLDPYFLDTNWIFSFDYFRIDADYYGFLRSSNGGDVNFGYHLTPDLLLFLAYGLEHVDVEPSSLSAAPGSVGSVYSAFSSTPPIANQFQSGLNSTVTLTLTYDKRDNRLFPSNGYYGSGSVQYGPKQLGGTFNFIRYSANGRYYRPLFLGIVFKTNATLGYVEGIQGSTVPISELYYVGGINSVRGYYLRTITPTKAVGATANPDTSLTHYPEFPVGGDKQLVFNFELEFPIIEKIGIRGVVFADAGNAYAPNENFFQDKHSLVSTPAGLLYSVGVGVRWFSPIGPLRFEWGFPLTPRPGIDQPVDFEFTIGNFF